MAKNGYIGISDTAKHIKNMYIGVDGVARKVKAGYIGVDGVARQFYAAEHLFTITQSANQTITVTCNGNNYTSNFMIPDGAYWTASISAIAGYNPGTLSATSGTATSPVEVHASAATPALPMTLAEEKTYWNLYGESAYSWSTSSSGRQFARCKCNKGTIMKWNDNGIIRYTIILDAKYRTTTNIYINGTTDLGFTTKHTYGGYPITGSDSSDAVLNSSNIAKQDTRNSQAATNEWINKPQYGSDMPAFDYVINSLSSNSEINISCNIPTINCLVRIKYEADFLDNQDITVSSYMSKSLSYWFSDGYNQAWSSSWYGYEPGYGYESLYISKSEWVSGGLLTTNRGVIPVLEL